jgi:hypothetical protein
LRPATLDQANTPDMTTVTTITFAAALAELQAMLGDEVRLLVNPHGTLSGCVLEGRLDRVDTVQPDGEAVKIIIEGGQGITLDPADLADVILAGSSDGRQTLDFLSANDVVFTVERL